MLSQQINEKLQAAIKASGLHLAQVSTKSGVSYNKIYRMVNNDAAISVDDANAIHKALRGEVLVVIK